MFTEDMLKEVPEEIERILKQLEKDLFDDLIDRIGRFDEISRTADYELWMIQQLQRYPSDLRKKIQKALKLTDDQLKHLYSDVIEKGYAYDEALYKAAEVPFTPFEKNKWLKQMIDAIQEQTKDDLNNITRTTGIITNNGKEVKTMTNYFRDVLNKAAVEIQSGAFNYDSTLKRITNELANSGLRTISYESGHQDRVDVAARRAVLTGLKQVTMKISDNNAEALGTEYFEVSAHLTARPSHAVWQGQVYTKEQLVSVCGLGTVTGLLGANCYHSYDPFIPGISVRRYSDKELSDIFQKTQEMHEYGGRKYTLYEATQRQRALERRMRVQDEKIALLKRAGADPEEIRAIKTRRFATYQEYKKFSGAMKLPEQMNRVFNSEVKVSNNLSKNFADVTDVYLKNAHPGEGSVTMEEGYVQNSSHDGERETAAWLLNNYGGNIKLLKESQVSKERTADSLWNGKLWEYKDVSSKSSVNKLIGKGIQQIKTNPGGLVLNVVKNINTGEEMTDTEVLSYVCERLKFYQKYESVDAIIKRGDTLIKVIRMIGEKK